MTLIRKYLVVKALGNSSWNRHDITKSGQCTSVAFTEESGNSQLRIHFSLSDFSGFNTPSNRGHCDSLVILSHKVTHRHLMIQTPKQGFGWPRKICMKRPIGSLKTFRGEDRPTPCLSQQSSVLSAPWVGPFSSSSSFTVQVRRVLYTLMPVQGIHLTSR